MRRRMGTLTAGGVLALVVLVGWAPWGVADAPRTGFPGGAGSVVERSGADGRVPTERFYGRNREDTASLLLRDGFHPASTVLLARSDLFPDALAASYLGGQLGTGVLLTPSSTLAPEALGALRHVGAQRVIILGGPAAVSTTVESQLVAAGFVVERIAGADRYETAARIATRPGSTVGLLDGRRTALVATGENFPDALAVGPVAYGERFPLLLTPRDRLHPQTRSALVSLGIGQVIIPGGTAAVSAAVEAEIAAMGIRVIRLAGADRVATAVAVARFALDTLGWSPEVLNIAVGSRFPDALAVGPHAGRGPWVVLLVADVGTLAPPGSPLPGLLRTLGCQVGLVRIAGGPAAVSVAVEDQVRVLVNRACGLVVAPADATNPVGTAHTVTATVTDLDGQPRSGELVRFEVFRSTDGGATFTGPVLLAGDVSGDGTDDDNAQVTEGPGVATFDYTGPDEGAVDIIVACVDLELDGCATVDPGTGQPVVDPDDPALDTALKVWQEQLALTLDPADAENEVGSAHTVVATLTRGAPPEAVDGQPLTFEVFRSTDGGATFTGPVTEGMDVTNDDLDDDGDPVAEDDGQATFDYPGPTQLAVDRIVVCVDVDDDGCASVSGGGQVVLDTDDVVATATKTWVAGPPANLQLTPTEATNEVGSDHEVTATVTDEFGNPVAGVEVHFEVFRSTDGGTTFTGPPPEGTATTDAAGQAAFSYTGPTSPALDRIVACLDEDEDGVCATPGGGVTDDPEESLTARADKTWVPGPPAVLTVEPQTATNEVGSDHTLTATVSDGFGNPLDDVSVRFEVFRSTDGGSTFTGPVETGVDATADGVDDDGDSVSEGPGQATFDYTGPTSPATDRIVACIDSDGDLDCATVDGSGQVVLDPDDDLNATADKTWVPGPPAALTLEPKTASNEVGTDHEVTATVTDGFGNPLQGQTVRFEVYRQTGTTILGDPTYELVTSGTDTTDAAGQATFTYTGPTDPATDLIVACIDGDADGCASLDPLLDTLTIDDDDLNDTADKTWEPAGPSTLTLTPADDANEVGDDHTVTATVTDPFGNPVEGVTVRFEVFRSTDGGSTYSGPVEEGTDTTDAAGQAAFSYTGPTSPATDRIVACIDSDGDLDCATVDGSGQVVLDPDDDLNATADKDWVPGPPAALVLEPSSDTNVVGRVHTLTATVVDSFGNPLDGVLVRFDLFRNTGSGWSFVSADTDTTGDGTDDDGDTVTEPPGTATFDYTGPTTEATDTIVACIDGDSDGCATLAGGTVTPDADDVNDTATKRWVPMPDGLTVAPATDTNTVGTSHTVTATLTSGGNDLDPVDGLVVTFEVYRSTDGGTTFTGPVVTATDVTNDDVDDDGDAVGGGEDPGEATFDYTGPTSPATDHIVACWDDDGDGCATVVAGLVVLDTDDLNATADKDWVPGPPAALTLSPAADTNPVGTVHTVVATVTDALGNPLDGVEVTFEVYEETGSFLGEPTYTAGATGTDDTGDGTDDDGDAVGEGPGEATFDYAGPADPATHLIVACIDADSDGCASLDPLLSTLTIDGDDINDTADKTWEERAPATIELSPEADTNPVGTVHTVTATVRDQFGDPIDVPSVRFEVYRSTDGGATYQFVTARTDATGDGKDDDGDSVTEATGVATFDYTGPNTPASDIIVACIEGSDADLVCATVVGGQVQPDPDDIHDTATKDWVNP